ncbi:MAG: hypothetical protein ABI668_03530 [Sphingorhabdus sp.]
MTSRSKIVGLARHTPDDIEIDAGSTPVEGSDGTENDLLGESEADWAETVEYGEYSARRSWTAYVIPGSLCLTLAAWTGFFGWTYLAEAQQGLDSERVASLVTTWSVPALLLATIWLLFMRSSRAEADRFGDAARILRIESEALELRMRTVNEEIAMAREFLAQNARELESVGRQSSRKLVEAAEQLTVALADSDQKAKTLEAVSNAATSNLEQLRKHLPVVTSAAKDVTNQIGSAGNNAQLQVKVLIAALQRVSDAGKSAREFIDDMETRAEEAGSNLLNVIGQGAAVLADSTEAAEARTAEMAQLMETSSAKMKKNIASVSSDVDSMVAQSSYQLEAQLATLGDSLGQLAEEAGDRLITVIGQGATVLADSTEAAEARTAEIAQLMETTSAKLKTSIASVSSDVDSMVTQSSGRLEVQLAKLSTNLGQLAEEAGDRLTTVIGQGAAVLADSTEAAEARTAEMAQLMETTSAKLKKNIASVSSDVGLMATQSSGQLEAQLAALRDSLGQLAQQTDAEDSRIATMIQRISVHMDDSASRIASIDAEATDNTAKLAFAVSALNESTRNVGASLGDNQTKTNHLLQRSERLLVALDSANREIDESLPAAMDRMDARFAASLSQLQNVTTTAETLSGHSDDMLAKINSIEHLIGLQRASVERLMTESDEHFTARHEQADALAAALTHTRKLVEEMTETANDKLVASLLRVRETTRQTAESSRKILDEEMATVAERLSEQNRTLLANAIDNQISALNDSMQSSIERNLAISETTTAKMSAQLAQIDEMTGNLERRLSDAHEGFDGIGDDSFARQMVLLTESLNSTAIDVAKILSNEVTDTAWAAYLKGDRGVFTRRAVRLLDAGEARAIAAHYGDDSEFREHVNRYIHDFEAMMRVLLSTRDGNAIGVTLLSSDVGKLYVALAQAIERLRN